MKLRAILLALTLLSIAACKKDTDDNNKQTAAVEFTTCPVYPSVVHSYTPAFTYTADIKNPTNASVTGKIQLQVTDKNNVTSTVNEQSVTLIANDGYFYSYSGELSMMPIYEPATFKFTLNFVNGSDGTTKVIGGNSCTNPSSFIVKDTLYGTATATFVNARYDSVPTNFTYLGQIVTSNVAPLSSVTGFEVRSGTRIGLGIYTVDVAPGSHVTCFEVKTRNGAIENIIVPGNFTLSNPAKAYVRYVNTTDAAGTDFTVQKGGIDVPEFKQKAFLEFSSFVPFDPGITSFTFKPDFVSSTVGQLDINLGQGQFYTIYQPGYIDPGFSQNVKPAQYIQHN